MLFRTVSNLDDVIDSRDIIERISELHAERDDHNAADDGTGSVTPWHEEFPEDATELSALEALAKEAEQYAADWRYGEMLVRDSYFVEYAQRLLEDCGDVPKNIPSYLVIDWDATARNIRYDYTAVDFGGVTYWIR